MGKRERAEIETMRVRGSHHKWQNLRVVPGEAPIDGSLLREIMEREGRRDGQQDSGPLPKQEQ